MANSENLRPPFSPNEAREYGKIGAAKSAESKRRKKTIVETVETVLNQPVKDEKQLAAIRKAGLPVAKKPTYRDFIVASILLRTAQKGRMDDLQKLIDITGEGTTDGDGALAELIAALKEK